MSYLTRAELLQLLSKLMNPKEYSLSQRECDEILISFCGGCPDPINARWLIVECLEPLTDGEIVERVLAMPSRQMTDVPFSIVPKEHPSRGGLQ